MGLSLEYFYSLTPRVFDNILTGFRTRQETDFKNQWQIARTIAFASIAPYLPKHIKTPQQYMPLPWENEQDANEPQSIDDIEIQVLQRNIPFWARIDAQKKVKQSN